MQPFHPRLGSEWEFPQVPVYHSIWWKWSLNLVQAPGKQTKPADHSRRYESQSKS